jgi:hypothetical protein
MDRLSVLRQKLLIDAFSRLEVCHRLLAEMLIVYTGSRIKAAQWMCSHHHVLGGRSGYDVIADGEIDMVWDLIANK